MTKMKEITPKKAFYIHENHYELLMMLNERQCGRLFRALFEYHKTGYEPLDLDNKTKLVFISFRQAMDQDRISYEERCQRNQMNGKRGGRPSENPEKPKKPDIDIDMDTDMDIDMNIDMNMDMNMDMEDGFAPQTRVPTAPPTMPAAQKNKYGQRKKSFSPTCEKTYDTDEFFEAAVRRGLKEIDFGKK